MRAFHMHYYVSVCHMYGAPNKENYRCWNPNIATWKSEWVFDLCDKFKIPFNSNVSNQFHFPVFADGFHYILVKRTLSIRDKKDLRISSRISTTTTRSHATLTRVRGSAPLLRLFVARVRRRWRLKLRWRSSRRLTRIGWRHLASGSKWRKI